MLLRNAALIVAGALLLPALLLAAPREQMLVTPAWLRAHLQDPNLVLLQVGPKADYAAGHIPGARFLELRMISQQSAAGLELEMLPVATLDSVLASLGVTSNSRVILYFTSEWVSPTTRAWLTLDYAGLGTRASILDGGLAAWTAAGGQVTSAPVAVVTGSSLNATPSTNIVVDADWVQAHQGQPHFRLLDARDSVFYQGLDAGSGSRPGHLPAARNLPYFTVLDSAGRFLPDSVLRRLFQEAGVSKGDEVVAYCHIGQQATAIVFAARLLGYDARLYDGSFQDWSRRSALRVDGAVTPTHGMLISTTDLATRIAGNNITVIDLRSDLNAYLADHLPGAVYLHYENLRGSASGIPADTLSPASYAAIWSRIGIRRDRPVVIYGDGDATNVNATFLAWLLAGFRQPEVYLLDGGYAKWSAEGRTLTRLYPEVAAVKYANSPYLLDLIEGEHVGHMTGNPGVVLVDVREPDQYAGAAGTQLRRGHIPGAINHFWHDDLRTVGNTTVWKGTDELRAAYEAQGITPDKLIIVYCNTAREASQVYFALHFLLGYPDVKVYAPGWTEWAEHTEWPVETSVAAATGANKATAAAGKSCSDH